MNTTLTARPVSSVDIDTRVEAVDWASVSTHLDGHGWAILKTLLTADECQRIAGLYEDDRRFRSHVVMARHGFGRGEYKYFAYPLPDIVTELCMAVYPRLVAIANHWNESINIDVRFPTELGEYPCFSLERAGCRLAQIRQAGSPASPRHSPRARLSAW